MFSRSSLYPFLRRLRHLTPVLIMLFCSSCDAQGLPGLGTIPVLSGLSRSASSENQPPAAPKQTPEPAAKVQKAQAVEAAPLPSPPAQATPRAQAPAAEPAPLPASAPALGTSAPAATQPFVTPQTLPQPAPAAPSGTIRTADMTYVPPGEDMIGSASASSGPSGSQAFSSMAPGNLPTLSLKSGQRLRAALLVPMSGPSAALGKSLLNAAQMALFEMGGSGFSLIPVDTRGTPEGAAAAARQAVEHGAQIILGPLFSGEVKAVTPIALSSGVNVIAFSSDRAAAQPGIYLLGFLPRPQVERVVAHAFAQGVSRFAALAPNNDYGRTMTEAFKASVAQHGGTMVETLYFDPSAKDFADVVKRLARFDQRKAALNQLRRQLEAKGEKAELKKLEKRDTIGDVDYQAVFLPDEGGRLRSLAALLPYYDIDTPKVKLLGTMQWDDPTLASEPALNGAWYAGAPPDGRAGFDERYKQAFGAKPPRLASLGYDAAALTAVLAQSGQISTAQLLNPQGFAGVDGLFRLQADGTSERGLAVMEVQRGTPRVLAPAPGGF